mmetsp:Transcript_2222/g.6504  ORF Transcript_2222/g.6504 Transcript_2222/m.6504 type:complete len:215 (+) Transcript_2222:98-742(+)
MRPLRGIGGTVRPTFVVRRLPELAEKSKFRGKFSWRQPVDAAASIDFGFFRMLLRGSRPPPPSASAPDGRTADGPPTLGLILVASIVRIAPLSGVQCNRSPSTPCRTFNSDCTSCRARRLQSSGLSHVPIDMASSLRDASSVPGGRAAKVPRAGPPPSPMADCCNCHSCIDVLASSCDSSATRNLCSCSAAWSLLISALACANSNSTPGAGGAA